MLLAVPFQEVFMVTPSQRYDSKIKNWLEEQMSVHVAECRGLHNYQYHFEVYLRYLIL